MDIKEFDGYCGTGLEYRLDPTSPAEVYKR
jgi:hypothetical protein